MEERIFTAADKYKALRDEKDELQFKLKELNAKLEQHERELVELMLNEEVPSFKRNGSTFSVVTKEYPAAIPESKPVLYDEMKKHGFEDLFTINTNTLSATVKDLKANNDDVLPEWLDGLIKITEKQSIALRK